MRLLCCESNILNLSYVCVVPPQLAQTFLKLPWHLIVWQSGDTRPWRGRRSLYCVKPSPTQQVSTSGSTTTPRSTLARSSLSPRSFECTQATMPAWHRILTSTPAPKKPSAWLSTVSVSPPILDHHAILLLISVLTFFLLSLFCQWQRV